MNTDALRLLGKNAHIWAKAYTAVVEALLREGVPEEIAREEARAAANFAMFFPDEQDSEREPDWGEL